MLSLVHAVAEGTTAPIIAPPWVFPLIAAIVFIVLAVVSWSYRDVANRHSDKTSDAASHSEHGGHGH